MRHSILFALALAACASEGGPAVAKTTGDTKPSGDVKPSSDAKPTGDTKPVEPAKPFARNDEAAVRAAYKSASGRDLGDDACVAWPESFPRVALIGGFASDRGCDLDGVFIDRTLHTGDAVQAGVATRDFKAAVLADKEAIARAWVDEVEHAFGGSFVTTESKAFTVEGSPKFEPVRARENKIGGVVVEGWVQRPSGMNDESSFDFVVYRFAPDGALASEVRNSFTVPGEKLRAAETKAGG